MKIKPTKSKSLALKKEKIYDQKFHVGDEVIPKDRSQ
jgi:hypothetical protein